MEVNRAYFGAMPELSIWESHDIKGGKQSPYIGVVRSYNQSLVARWGQVSVGTMRVVSHPGSRGRDIYIYLILFATHVCVIN